MTSKPFLKSNLIFLIDYGYFTGHAMADRGNSSTENPSPGTTVVPSVIMKTHFTRIVHEGDDQDLVCSCKLLNSHTLWLKVLNRTVKNFYVIRIECFDCFVLSERSRV